MSEIEALQDRLASLRAIPTPSHRVRESAIEEIVGELAGRLLIESRTIQDAIRPTVYVHPAEVRVEPLPPAEVRIEVPDQSDAISGITAALERIAGALETLAGREMAVNVQVPEQPPPVVNVQVPDEKPERKRVTVERGRQGLITGLTIEEQE